jgi:hypothetical protein
MKSADGGENDKSGGNTELRCGQRLRRETTALRRCWVPLS